MIGGRNQELVLRILKNTQKTNKLSIAAMGTDGIDGNTLFAGAITEKDKTLAMIKAERDVKIAITLASIKSPAVVMTGGGEPGSGGQDTMMKSMINYRILQQAGILPNNGRWSEILPVPMEAPISK